MAQRKAKAQKAKLPRPSGQSNPSARPVESGDTDGDQSTDRQGGGPDNNKAGRTGYCNPPVEHQWQTGQSGNPAGSKPKKKQQPEVALNEALASILGIIAKILTEPHMVPMKGGQQEMTIIEAGIRKYASQFMNGTIKEKNDTIKLLSQSGLLQFLKNFLDTYSDEHDNVFTEEDRLLLKIAQESCEFLDD